MLIDAAYMIGGLIIEAAGLIFFVTQEAATIDQFFIFIFVHAVATGLFAYGIYRNAIHLHFSSPRNWLILSAAVCFAFSAVGFITFVVMMLLIANRQWKKSEVYEGYEKYIDYEFAREERYLDPDKLAEATEAELEVSPLVDVLGEKDIRLRRGAINMMGMLPKKDAVKMLKSSLHDNNVEIRFHAAAELSKIETELNSNIAVAKKEVERDPESADAHLSLANAYSEYYESGILDDVTADYYRKLAIDEYYKVLDLGGEDTKVLNYLANLEVLTKDHDKALAKFKRVCEIEPDDVYANVGIIQIYFETGEIEQAIKYAKNIIKKMPETKGPMREIIQYWAS